MTDLTEAVEAGARALVDRPAFLSAMDAHGRRLHAEAWAREVVEAAITSGTLALAEERDRFETLWELEAGRARKAEGEVFTERLAKHGALRERDELRAALREILNASPAIEHFHGEKFGVQEEACPICRARVLLSHDKDGECQHLWHRTRRVKRADRCPACNEASVLLSDDKDDDVPR